MNKLKEQSKNRAYLHVKQELMKDIAAANREFLNSKAENMARKMLAEDKGNSLNTEIGKGRNYLSKIMGEYESRKEEDERLNARLKERVRAG